MHAYFLLIVIDVGQTKLFGKKLLCFNLNPIKPSQTFFKQWNGWSWKWFGALFLAFLISLVPYCLTVYVYLAFLGITKMWVSIRLLHWKRDLFRLLIRKSSGYRQYIYQVFHYLCVACKFSRYELWNIITFAQQHAC